MKDTCERTRLLHDYSSLVLMMPQELQNFSVDTAVFVGWDRYIPHSCQEEHGGTAIALVPSISYLSHSFLSIGLSSRFEI